MKTAYTETATPSSVVCDLNILLICDSLLQGLTSYTPHTLSLFMSNGINPLIMEPTACKFIAIDIKVPRSLSWDYDMEMYP